MRNSLIIICLFFLPSVSVYADPPHTPEEDKQFSAIKIHYFAAQFDLAQKELTDFIKAYPNHEQAKELLLKVQQWRMPPYSLQRQTTRTDFLKQVDQAWIKPEVEVLTLPITQKASTKVPLLQQLKTIVLPSIQLKDVPIKEVVALLANLAEKYNPSPDNPINLILMDPKSVNPNVTLSLKNLSLLTILNYIAQSINFQIEVEKDAVIIKREDDIKAILNTKTFPISRATVIQLIGEVPQKLEADLNPQNAPNHLLSQEEKSLKNFLSRAGVDFDIPKSSLAFDGTQLIVTQTQKNLQRIKNILSRYLEIKQVQIEAKFLEVQQGALEEIGFKWNMGKNNQAQVMTGNDSVSNLRTLNAFAKQTYTSGNGTILSGTTNIDIPNNSPNFPNSINTGSQSAPIANMLGVLNGYQMNFVMQALEQQSGSDLMSAPRITVLSGKKAEIVVAQEMRYPQAYSHARSNVGTGYATGGGGAAGAAGVTITAGTPSDFAVRNVGVQMSVTPTVQQDNQICLKLEPSVTEFEGFVEYGGSNIAISGSTTVRSPSGYFQPIFSVRRIHTEVIIQNHATVVMGGLTREEVKEVQDKVPLLGNLPLLGRLFQSKGETSQKRNLLIFVTASLLSTKGNILTETPER